MPILRIKNNNYSRELQKIKLIRNKKDSDLTTSDIKKLVIYLAKKEGLLKND